MRSMYISSATADSGDAHMNTISAYTNVECTCWPPNVPNTRAVTERRASRASSPVLVVTAMMSACRSGICDFSSATNADRDTTGMRLFIA